MTKIIRYRLDGEHYGELHGDEITPLEGAFPDFTPTSRPTVRLDEVTVLAPVVPGKTIGVGPNYRAHLRGNPPPPRPHYWVKPANTLLDPDGVILIPEGPPTTCHESELAVVIGRTARDVSAADAADHIFGYTCVNDVSAGLMHNPPEHLKSQYFVDGKIYDTFGPIGPWIETRLDPSDLRVRCRVNGETRQDHRTSDFIWTPAELVEFISHVVTLNPGDVIATGSPPGVAPLKPGDIVEIEVEGIGVLRNTCRKR